MDKAGDVRRGASGFSTAKRHINKQQSGGGHKFLGAFTAIRGDLQFSEKSKKEKLRSLSAVGRALSSYQQHCEMGCRVSEKQDSLPSHSPSSSSIASKRFKIPNFLNDCNGVHHASVPRKLRSAMKKRSRESMLSYSETVNHKMNGIESPVKESIKKSKVSTQESPDRSQREGLCGPITKEEEEVAETLYALAGMFPDNGSIDRKELDGKFLLENSSVLQDMEEKANAAPAFEVSGTAQDASPCPETSPREAVNISCSSETIGQEQPELPESAKFLMVSHSTTPKINLQTMPKMVRSENSNKVALHESELCLAMGLKMPRQSQISHIERKSDVEFETARGVDWKQEQHMIKDQKENEGPALWPALSPVASAVIHASHLQPSATKAPDWLDATGRASKQNLMECCSAGGKISEVVIHKRSWKRCAAQVHISHLIRSLEVPKRQVIKEPELYDCQKTRAHEGSKRGVLIEVHNLNGMSNGVTSAPETGHSATVRNPRETKNGILQQQCHYHDRSQAAPTPGMYAPQKQSFNFLSLSAGSNGLKIDNSYNQVGSRLEPLSKLQVPYFQSLAQRHGHMPIPTPQSQYASSSHLDQLSVAGPQVRLQQPYYYGSPLCGTPYSSTVSNKQQHQTFWAMQLAAHGRSAVNCNIMRTQYPNWQSGRHDSSVVSPCAQAIHPRSSASLEVLGSKINSISEQQQQLIALASSLPPSRTNGLDYYLPSVCDERGRFHSSGTPSLQLLCGERI